MKMLIGAAALLAASAAPANAATILNQIAANYTTSSVGQASQDFETANNAYDINFIDDFSVSAATNLTSIQAALVTGTGTLSGITGYRVEIYSSVAASAASLTGNVASVLVNAAGVTISNPFSAAQSGLVTIPVSINLAAGTYYIGVMAVNSFATNGQIYVYGNGTGSGNGYQANPSGGFAFTGGISQVNVSAAYNIFGNAVAAVPEPATWGMMIVGFGMVGASARARRRAAKVTFA